MMMRRRQLRLPSSDDEYGYSGDTNPPRRPDAAAPIDISDDEFLNDPPPPPPAAGVTYAAGSIGGFLRRMGLGVRPEWLDACLAALSVSVPGFVALDVATRAKMCFEEFLLSDMNVCGAGVLPENVHSMHMVELEGPFVLQVDEVVNTSSPLRERYHEAAAGPKRCLKLSLSDGNQRVFGMEYRPIKELEVLASAGFKIVIHTVAVHRGLLMLVPEILQVLGGVVEELDTARMRLVAEVNKPPRGRKQGSLPLSRRASLAAWPPDTVTVEVPSYSPRTPGANNARATDQVTVGNQETLTGGSNAAESSEPHNRHGLEEIALSETARRTIYVCTSLQTSGVRTNIQHVSVGHGTNTNITAPVNATSDVVDARFDGGSIHPYSMNRDQEIPFTYMAYLSKKYAELENKMEVIQGKIKCFLTSVKRFQFKDRRTFELHVYVDDGSLISEVLVDHSVVQNIIGHLPEEVSSALTSPDKNVDSNMRETMRRFQQFLAKFEGTMLIQISGASPLPVGLEMNQGCSSSDAWLLIRRLKTAKASMRS